MFTRMTVVSIVAISTLAVLHAQNAPTIKRVLAEGYFGRLRQTDVY